MENFTNGSIPDSMWTFFASATLLPFHKLPQDKRNPEDPKLRPITIGSALSRFACRVLLRLHRTEIAARLLSDSHQISYCIPGGVQQVIIICAAALHRNPDWVCSQWDMSNAHTTCSRGRCWEELESVAVYNFLQPVFLSLYGRRVTPQ